MAKTNLKARHTHARSTLTTHEGAPAKRIDAEAQLRRSVMACLLWENTFYEDGIEIAERIASFAEQVAPEVLAAIAVEARTEMYLRHAPLWLVRHLAKLHQGRLVGDTLAQVIQRPDELTEFISLYWKDGKQPLAAQVKRGLALAFPKFDAYQLAKYDREGAVKLRDVLFLSHAKPKDAEQAATWKQLVDGTLPQPGTWENELSAGKDKRETWTRLLTERKLGGLALLRNLRNMQQAGVDDTVIAQAIEANPFKRVLPFRFVAAAKYAAKFEPQLEAAMFRGCADLPKLTGKTALVVDHSQSMQVKLSGKSDLTRFGAACGLAILAREVCEQVVIVAFSQESKAYIPTYRTGAPYYLGRPSVAIVPARRGFALSDALEKATCWSGTDTAAGKALADREGYDRIIILTDEQSHTALSNPSGKGYVVNVATYRNGIGYGQWTHIDGWSEHVLRYIAACEARPPTLS